MAKTAEKTEAGIRGRKPLLVGLSPEDARAMRRALRAAEVRLSDLDEGTKVKVVKKDNVITVTVPGHDPVVLRRGERGRPPAAKPGKGAGSKAKASSAKAKSRPAQSQDAEPPKQEAASE